MAKEKNTEKSTPAADSGRNRFTKPRVPASPWGNMTKHDQARAAAAVEEALAWHDQPKGEPVTWRGEEYPNPNALMEALRAERQRLDNTLEKTLQRASELLATAYEKRPPVAAPVPAAKVLSDGSAIRQRALRAARRVGNMLSRVSNVPLDNGSVPLNNVPMPLQEGPPVPTDEERQKIARLTPTQRAELERLDLEIAKLNQTYNGLLATGVVTPPVVNGAEFEELVGRVDAIIKGTQFTPVGITALTGDDGAARKLTVDGRPRSSGLIQNSKMLSEALCGLCRTAIQTPNAECMDFDIVALQVFGDSTKKDSDKKTAFYDSLERARTMVSAHRDGPAVLTALATLIGRASPAGEFLLTGKLMRGEVTDHPVAKARPELKTATVTPRPAVKPRQILEADVPPLSPQKRA